jgi:predicted RNA methylase
MIHVGMLREKQVEMMESFKRRYLARFGGPLPVFLPEAVIMAVQPLQQEYDFEGFHAPIVQFQPTNVIYPGTAELAQPGVYSIMDFSQPTDMTVAWEGRFLIEKAGRLNALRFITKNVLSIIEEQGATIDWLNHYMMLPLAQPLDVQAGDVVQISFAYRCGGSIPSLEASIRTELVARFEEEAVREQAAAAEFA